jgi:hypothetical protein
VRCTAHHSAPDSTVRFWFLHQILPFALVLGGRSDVFHAGAVEIEGKAVAFLAPSHVGKSTLVNHFLTEGHALITDEHLAFNPATLAVQPSIPFYRPYRAAEDLGIRAGKFCTDPMPLGAIYLLEPVAADAPVALEPLKELEAATVLMGSQQYTTWNPALPWLFPVVKRRMATVTRLAAEARIQRLRVPRTLERISEVYEKVCEDMRRNQ